MRNYLENVNPLQTHYPEITPVNIFLYLVLFSYLYCVCVCVRVYEYVCVYTSTHVTEMHMLKHFILPHPCQH